MLSTFDPREEYLGNGLLDTYTFDFKITSLSHLRVIKLNSSGTVVFDVRGTDSTYIDSVTYDATDGGGQVVLVDAVETDYNLIILQANDEPLQEFEFKNKGDFTLSRFEQVLDIIVGAIQRLAYSSKRSLRAPEGTLDAVAFDGELDTLTAGSLVQVNDDGDGFTMGPTLTDFNADVAAAAASAAAASASASAAATSESNASTYEGLAQDWATKVNGIVDSTDYSSKAWAIGGTGVTDTASRGAAKEWAIETASTVDTSEYSAKEYAVGTQRRGAANGGSAKDWATYTSGTVDNTEYSSKYYAQQAAASAATASAAIDSVPWSDVVFKTFADSPLTLDSTYRGKLVVVDATGGAVTINLPAIAGLDLTETFAMAIKKSDSSANTVTIARGSTDTINGATSKVLSFQNNGCTLHPDTDTAPDEWTALDFGGSNYIVSSGNIGSSPNAKGLTVSGGQIVLEPADSTYGGVLTAIAQAIAGLKTFITGIIVGDAGTEGSGINVGGVTYESTFKVSDINGSNYAQSIFHRHSTTLEPLLLGARSNTNTTAHADVTNGMAVFSRYGVGWAGSNYKIFGLDYFAADDTGTINNTSSPGKWGLNITPDGSTTPVEAVKITNDGRFHAQNGLAGALETDAALTGADQTVGATKFIKRLTNASLASICGITAPTVSGAGFCVLINRTGADVTVKNDTTATAANRIYTGTGSNITWKNGSALWFAYDVTSSRWQVIGGSGGSSAYIFGSTGSPRSVVAATGIVSASSHMSTSEMDQVIFITSSVAAAITAVSANPQIEAHTVVGARMTIWGTSNDDVVELADGNGLSLNGSWQSNQYSNLRLMWNGTVWVEETRR